MSSRHVSCFRFLPTGRHVLIRHYQLIPYGYLIYFSPSFSEVIKTHFSHYEGFEIFSGQIYLIMIIDTCNTSAAIGIKVAKII